MTFIRSTVLAYLFLFAVTSNADVQQIKEVPKVRLTKLMKSLVQTQKYSLANIKISPENPQLGDTVTAYVELTTELEGSTKLRPFIKVKLNGNEVKSLNRFGRVWVVEPFLLNQEGEYRIDVEVFVEDLKASQEARDSLLELEKDIQWLLVEIENERDLTRKASLQNSLNSKLSWKSSLTDTLNSLRRLVTTQSKKIQIGNVVPNPPDENEPVVNDFSPNYGFLDGGYTVTATGVNLGNTSSIVFGGVVINSNLLQVNPTSITFTAPALPMGMHSLKINTLDDNVETSKTFKNVFFALEKNEVTPDPDPNPTEPLDLRPVAFAGLPKKMESGDTVELDGTLSYDEQDKDLTFSWVVVSKPFGALVTDGVLTGDDTSAPQFFATTSGDYVIALTVSNGIYSSAPSLTTVSVGVVDAVVIFPKQITGSVAPGDMYVGMFTICNNTAINSSYQILGSGFYLILSSRKGIINSKSCLSFQFSIPLESSNSLNISIPVVLGQAEVRSQVVEVSVQAAAPSRASLWIYYDGEGFGIDEIVRNYSLVLNGTHDEANITKIGIFNESQSVLRIENPPVITHVGGASGVFSVNFPVGGLTIYPESEVKLEIVTSPGNFNGKQFAEAIFDWDIGHAESEKVMMLKAHKLIAPNTYFVEKDAGVIEQYSGTTIIDAHFLRDFFSSVSMQGLYSVISVNKDDIGDFLFQLQTPVTFGSSDYFHRYKIDLLVEALPYTLGVNIGLVEVKVSGYSQPFVYRFKTEVIP